MSSVPLAAIMVGEVVFKKINGHVRKIDEVSKHAKAFPTYNNEFRVALNEQQARVNVIVARLDDVQRRVEELEGPASPESRVPKQELEPVPELVLEPALEQAADAEIVNPCDLRQYKSVFFKFPFCKVRTAEEVAEDLKWCYILIVVLMGILWYLT